MDNPSIFATCLASVHACLFGVDVTALAILLCSDPWEQRGKTGQQSLLVTETVTENTQ